MYFQPVLGRKFLVKSEFRDQGPPKWQEIEKIDVNIFKIYQKIPGNFLENLLYYLLKPFKGPLKAPPPSGVYLTSRVYLGLLDSI